MVKFTSKATVMFTGDYTKRIVFGEAVENSCVSLNMYAKQTIRIKWTNKMRQPSASHCIICTKYVRTLCAPPPPSLSQADPFDRATNMHNK